LGLVKLENSTFNLFKKISLVPIHAAQWENLSQEQGTSYLSDVPGLLDGEFEAKTIKGIVFEELGNSYQQPIDDIPMNYGRNGGRKFGSAEISRYGSVRDEWFNYLESRPDGYGGKRPSDPGMVTKSDPRLLKSLIKQ
jgi:hypothetical protein